MSNANESPGSDAGAGESPACRIHDLLRPEVLAAFDRAAFERDGYWVWEGILTDAGREQWTASLDKLQAMCDAMIMDTDWAAIDYAARGLQPPPPETLSAEYKRKCCGGKKLGLLIPNDLRIYMHDHGLFGPEPSLVTRGFESQGLMPEHFAPAYDEFILDVATAHPQMMELFAKLFGPRLVLDHIIMLNRAPGNQGSGWHAHPYRNAEYEVEDPIGTGNAATPEFLERQCVRTLVHTEGASREEGGELGVIPGAHLYRIPYKWSTARPDHDEDLRSGWLQGKTHPRTGAPLQMIHLSLPPGSMVSFVHHMPHHVGPRHPDAPTRRTLLMAYRTPDPQAEPARWSEGVPLQWVERQEATGRLSPAAKRVFAGGNPIP